MTPRRYFMAFSLWRVPFSSAPAVLSSGVPDPTICLWEKILKIFLFIMKGEHIKGQCHWGFELGSFLPFERFCKIFGLGRSRIRVGKISDPDPNYFNSDPQKLPLRKTIYRTYWSLFCLTSFLLRLPVLVIYELKSVHMLNTWGASGFLVP